MLSSWMTALAGGGLIGGAAAWLLLTTGRIAGISGITGGTLAPGAPDRRWRLAFLGGLIAAGALAAVVAPASIGAPTRSWAGVIVAGLLVGYGTQLGNGCTSGHGVCGLGRGSPRSLAAVATFMTTGALTAWLAGGLS